MTTIYLNHKLGLLITDSRATQTEVAFNFWNYVFPKIFKSKINTVGHTVVSQKSVWLYDKLFTASGNVWQIDKYLNYIIFGQEPNFAPEPEYNFNAMLISKSWVLCLDCECGKLSKQFYCIGQNGTFTVSMGSGADHIIHLVYGNDMVNVKDLTEEYIISEFRNNVVLDPHSDDNINVYLFKEKTHVYK